MPRGAGGAFACALAVRRRVRADAATRDRRPGCSARLETGLAEALGGTVRIGRIDVDWTALAATVGDVAISIPAEGAAPLTATIGEARVKLAWSGLTGIAGGDVHLTEVVARGATFSCSREWIDACTCRRARRTEIRWPSRSTVSSSTTRPPSTSTGISACASQTTRHEFSRRLVELATPCSSGRCARTPRVEAPLFDRPWPATVRGGLRLGGGRLEIFGATGRVRAREASWRAT